MKVAKSPVIMFRTQVDPMIGPKPRNAFMPKDLGWNAYINEEATGVVVEVPNKDGSEITRHFVFGANIQSIRLGELKEEVVHELNEPVDKRTKEYKASLVK